MTNHSKYFRKPLCFFISIQLFPLCMFAQSWTIDLLTDSISVKSPFTDTRTLVFKNRYPQYDNRYYKYGLHFRNNLSNDLSNTVRLENLFGSPTIGASGQQTVVDISGKFQSDGGQSVPHLVATNGGKIRFTSSALVDLVLPNSFFTRQFWCMGDGTGSIEFMPGFIADRTLGGTADSGLGSIRLNKVNLITHESQGLPLGYRPNPSLINAHLVFERNDGSSWTIKTNHQEYKGGLWVSKNIRIETQKDLTLSGVKSVWPDYVNFGGLFLEDTNVQLTKTGTGKLILSGEHGYSLNTSIRVEAGAIEFKTDPFNEADSIFYLSRNRKHGQQLGVELHNNAILRGECPSIRIRKLLMLSSSSRLELLAGCILKSKKAELNGVFEIDFPDGITLTAGDTFKVFQFDTVQNRFQAVLLPTFGGAISWDTTQLYSKGVLKIGSGTVITFNKSIETPLKPVLYPNPSTGKISIRNADFCKAVLKDCYGKVVFSGNWSLENRSLNLPRLKTGLYFYQLFTNEKEIGSGRLVLE